MERRQELTRQIVVRVDEDLYEALERDARENERTVSASIRYRLKQLAAS